MRARPGECVRLDEKVLLEGRRRPGGGGLERRVQAPLRDGCPVIGGPPPCGKEGGREERARCATDGDVGAEAGPWPPPGLGLHGCAGEHRLPEGAQAWEVRRTPVHLSLPTPSVASSAHPGGASLPWLSSPFRSRASMRTRASREKPVLSLSKGRPCGPIGASRPRPQA
jgi:hypothetical protein